MIASNTQELDGGEAREPEGALTSLTPSPPPFKPEASSVSRFERPSTTTATIALLPAAANAPVNLPHASNPHAPTQLRLLPRPLATVARCSPTSRRLVPIWRHSKSRSVRGHAFMQAETVWRRAWRVERGRPGGALRGSSGRRVAAAVRLVQRGAPAAPPPPRSPLWSHAPPPTAAARCNGTHRASAALRAPSSAHAIAPPSGECATSARGARGRVARDVRPKGRRVRR